jgi:hypothetical protein
MTVYVVLGVIVLATAEAVALISRIKRVRRAWYEESGLVNVDAERV